MEFIFRIKIIYLLKTTASKKIFIFLLGLFFIILVFIPKLYAQSSSENTIYEIYSESGQSDIIDINWIKKLINEDWVNKIVTKLAELGIVVKTEIRTITIDDGELSKIINSDLQNISSENIDSFIKNSVEVKEKLEKLQNILDKEIF